MTATKSIWCSNATTVAILAFEVKAAGQVAGRDMRHLRKLRDALGERFLTGVARQRKAGVEEGNYEKARDDKCKSDRRKSAPKPTRHDQTPGRELGLGLCRR